MLPLLQVIFLLASSLVAWTSAFPVTTRPATSLHHGATLRGLHLGGKAILLATTNVVPPGDNGDNVNKNDNIRKLLQLDRREWFQQAGRISLGCSIISTNFLFRDTMAHAATPTEDQEALGGRSVLLGSTPEHPIVILGAGGKTGKLCTQALAKKRLYCRAVTRSGRQTLDGSSSFVSYVVGDVSDYESTRAAIKGADGVIFAASASGKPNGRGDPAHVDYLGAYHTAKVCLEENVPKLVLISAGAVTRPDSAGFVALNVLTKFLIGENIMGYKAAGEQAIRDAYATASTKCGYTIIRPGGLADSEALGASKIHISQGDVFSSEISRTDVAEVAVACLLKGKATDSCTFEINNIKGLYKTMGNLPDLPPELLHAGAPSYFDLLDGLKTDSEMLQSYYPKIVSNFAGGKDILSIDTIIQQQLVAID